MLNNMSVVIPTRITTPYLSDVDVNIPLASKVLLIKQQLLILKSAPILLAPIIPPVLAVE